MQRTIQTLLLVLVFSVTAIGQEWHIEFPNTQNTLFPNADFTKTSDGIVAFLEGNIVELTEDGELKYDYGDLTLQLYKNTFIEKLSDSYLMVGSLGVSQSSVEILRLGFDNQTVYNISIQNKQGNIVDSQAPAAVYNPSTDELFIGSLDSIYLLNVSNGQILWRKPATGRFSDVIIDGNDYIAVSKEGAIYKFTNTGNQVWSTNLGFEINTVAKTGTSSYIAGGTDANGDIRVDFVDLSGNFLSSETHSTGEVMNIKKLPNDQFIAAVESNGFASLMKFKTNGLSIWQQFYDTGKPQKVELTDDEGFLLLVTNAHQIIKTDNDGNTSNNKNKRFIKGYESISISNINAVFGADGTMFNEGFDALSEAPKGSGVNSIFAAELWIGGLDVNNNLHFSNNFSSHSGLAGFPSEEFNTIWKINRDVLRDFKNDIGDGVADNPIPHHILTYPAKGNPHFSGRYNKFYDITKQAAPFIDINNDGIYNAYDGDYPVMKGDEMLIWLMNDVDTTAQSISFGLDIIVTVYGYECLDNDAVNNNLFVNFDIINQSTEDYHDVYLGMYNDYDLGCFNDDYVGVDTISNTTYVYNIGSEDGVGGCQVPSYGLNIPVLSSTFLNHSMNSHLYYENGNLLLSGTNAFYQSLQGRWGDGTSITASGNGYLTSGAVTPYAFTGNPSDTSAWSMCSETLAAYDYRSVGGSGPYLIPQGQIMSFEIMYTIHPDIPHPCPDITSDVIPTINTIQSYYDNDELDWEINLGLDRTIDANSTITLDPSYSNGSNYSWSTGANTSTIDVSIPGVYQVTVTHANGCKKTDEVNIYAYTSTNEIIENIKTKLYPNPAQNYFQVDFDVDMNVNQLTFELTNTIGQTLKSQISNESNGQMIFDTSDLPTGIYFLNIQNKKRLLKTLKVVIE